MSSNNQSINKIAIVGYGVEGRANLSYLKKRYPEATFTIFDQKQPKDYPKDVALVVGQDAFTKISGFDLVMRSPGIAPKLIQQQTNHWSATREFLRHSPAPIIGVTGSKGKGTTCGFIEAILNAHFKDHNRRVYLLGNIGVPSLSLLSKITADDLVVYELSSFQLWDTTQSPHVAVLTNIEPDHLDVHDGIEEYVLAKMNIFKFQQDGDTAIYGTADQAIVKLIENINHDTGADSWPCPDQQLVHFDNNNFYFQDQIICPVSVVKLVGRHNLLNAAAAISATWDIIKHDRRAVAEGLANFKGLPHRLQHVATVQSIDFYDDSIATTAGSAIAALKTFTNPKIIILGGSDKGGDYRELAELIFSSNVRGVVAIGKNRNKIIKQLEIAADKVKANQLADDYLRPIIKSTNSQSMGEIVRIAYQLAQSGDVVIMSPAAASFDMFSSYAERGQKFVAAVNSMLK